MNDKVISIKKYDGFLITDGLLGRLDYEIEIKTHRHVHDAYVYILTYIIDYVMSQDQKILPNQTISFHAWILKFILNIDRNLSVWEASAEGDNFIQGGDYALNVYQEQMEVCGKYNTGAIFPIFNQNIVISKGVYEGEAIQAVRYPSPSHMTGWWITTDLYDGDINSLMNVHYYHVAFKRPEILKYLALPYGYRFFSDGKIIDIRFDEKALQ